MATAVYSTDQGHLARWLKNEGDEVRKSRALAEVAVDSGVTYDVDAPESGVLRKCFLSVGDAVDVGTMIAIIAAPDEDISSVAGAAAAPLMPAAASQAPARAEAVPAEVVERVDGGGEPGSGATVADGVRQAEADQPERGAPSQAGLAEAAPAAAAPAPAPPVEPPAAARGAGEEDGRVQAPAHEAGARTGGERTGLAGGRVDLPPGAVSFAHRLIQDNLFGGLYQALRRTPYRTVPQGTPITPGRGERALLPDVAVCGRAEFEPRDTELLLNPVLLAEVCSPETADYDHGRKWRSCRAIPSLKEYVLIAEDEPLVERYTRRDEGGWVFSEVEGLDAEVRLDSIAATLRLAEIYEGVLAADPPSA